jgi:hypothetical protein
VRRSELRLAAAVIAGALLVGACSTSSAVKHGVGVRSINTDIGLGVDVNASTAPANTLVRPTQQAGPNQPPPITIPPLTLYTPPPSIVQKCPTAGPFDFPAKEAGVEPTGQPVPATYTHKIDGTIDYGSGPQKLDTFDSRTIKDVQPVSGIPQAFRYTQTQSFLVDQRQHGVLSTTFRVVPVSPAQTSRTNSDVGRGIFIESIHFQGTGPNGNLSTSFNPQPPVQLMAFPVIQGAGVAGNTPQTGTPITSSSGTDPQTGATLTITGTVTGKKQVDACGKKVDSWLTSTIEDYTFNDSSTGQSQTLESRYNYAFAIQYGSILVYEHTEAPAQGPVLIVDDRIASIPKGPKSG